MKTLFYPRLAWSGIVRNRKLSVPYLLSCIGMAMMYYILHALSVSPLLTDFRGGSSIGMVLSLGKFVIAVFALLFLFYTNSFLVRRRMREFGLYAVLGMDRRGIGRVVLWESLMTAGIGLAGGIGCGILFSKFAELGLLRAIRGEVDERFSVSGEAVLTTVLLFGVIFLILTVRSLIQVRKCRPLELLKTESFGERAPKANWVPAVIGAALLATAYVTAVSIRSPLNAMTAFFAAVIMVIIATYLLFISGSVALCALLKKNRKYYYQKRHFVSVSTMAFRMKRNGAGLASVCILSTMVLVMISSTASLYFGANDAIKGRFPRDNELVAAVHSFDRLDEGKRDVLRETYEKTFAENGVVPENVYEYRFASIAGMTFPDGSIRPDVNDNFTVDFDRMRMLYFITLDEYNRLTGESVELDENEVLLCPFRCSYAPDTVTVGDLTLRVAEKTGVFPTIEEANAMLVPSLLMAVKDFETIRPLEAFRDEWEGPMMEVKYVYAYDAPVDDAIASDLIRKHAEAIRSTVFLPGSEGGFELSVRCLADEKSDFFTTFGGLFFLGIMLSVVFVFAAAMILYDKQVSEGYEDRARFSIMKKVGMTGKDIRQSIDSQVLIVFFAPLAAAGLHIAFAFPLIWKLLQLFNLHNLTLVVIVTILSILAFAAVYALIYRLTARAYYGIVSSDRKN